MKLLAGSHKKLLLLLLMIMSTGLNSCFKNLTKTIIVYQNDFENNRNGIVLRGWVNGTVQELTENKIVSFNDTKVLGRFNNSNVELKLDRLPAHNALKVEFDLYLHDKWKNSVWIELLDDSYQYITGFSNDSSVQQSYPNWYGNGSALSPAGADAYTSQLPGYCSLINSARGSSMYKMSSTILHSKSSFKLNLTDVLSPLNDTCSVSWSIDNLKVTLLNN